MKFILPRFSLSLDLNLTYIQSFSSMKKIFLSGLILVAGAATGFAQKLVLLEQFTNASCPPCAAQNPALNALLNQNESKIVAIKYQVSWPGADPMNAANPSEAAARVSYYGVTGVPTCRMDGAMQGNGSPSAVTQSAIDTRNSGTTGAIVKVHYEIIDNSDPVADSLLVTSSVKAVNFIPAGYILHTVAIEREIKFVTAPGSNGEKEFEGVMKKMFSASSPNSGGSGTTLPALNAGDSVSYSFKYSLKRTNGTDVYYNIGQAAAVAFVQNNSTKEVLGAGYDEPRPWLAVSRPGNSKPVRIKAGSDVTFDFVAESKIPQNQDIEVKAIITGLPAGWSASIVENGVTYPGTATVPLPGNSSKTISVKLSGPNDAVLNKKYSGKIEINSTSIFPSVKSSLNFTAITPSNILFMDLAGTASSRFTQAFTAATQSYTSLTAEESAGLDSAGLNVQSIKKIFYSTGASFSGTLDAEKSETFLHYLNGGGNLFIMGQDIGYEVNGAGGDPDALDFYNNILGAEYISDGTTAAHTVVDVEEDQLLAVHVAPFLNTALSLPSSTSSYPDQLSVFGNAGNAAAFLMYSNTDNIAGIYNFGDNWKSIYIGFRMESVGVSAAPVAFRNALIKTANNWFDNVLTSNDIITEMRKSGPAYPNPAQNLLQVPVGSGKGKVSLTNVTGQLVRAMELDGSQNLEVQLSLKGLKSGVYFLTSELNGVQAPVQKIIVE